MILKLYMNSFLNGQTVLKNVSTINGMKLYIIEYVNEANYNF